MLIGSGGAMLLGMWSEAAILILVYSLGDVLESYAVDKARGAIWSLVALMPKEALVRKNGQEVVLPTEDISVGDVVVVRPGERIPVDGEVTRGSSYVDQAAVTGESIPVHKKPGADVFAGTINQNGALEVKVSKPASETMLSKIICSVEEAQAKKTSYQRFSDNFAKYYTPVMFVLGVLVATVPPLLLGAEWHTFIYRGLVVFVVSCSCGLALSVPVAVVAAMANAARNGTVFKGGAYLEVVDRVKAIAFDKTGTLTIGRPEVTDIHTFNGVTEKELLDMAGSIESRSGHPVAAAIVRKARESDAFSGLLVDDFQETSGRGVAASVRGQQYVVGNVRLQEERSVSLEHAKDMIANLENEGKTIVVVSAAGRLIGLLAIADKVRPGAKEALQRLRDAGIRTVMLTGDNERSAKAIAQQVGVDEYYAQLLPTDKVDVIKKLKDKYGSVAMVGDGINDAPAMAVSNVGIAMGAAGTDIAIEAGDVVLMSDDLSKIGYLRELSSKAVSNIKVNIIVSLVNIAFMVLAALIGLLGLVTGLLLNEASALIVIINALLLLNWRSKAETATTAAVEENIPSPAITVKHEMGLNLPVIANDGACCSCRGDATEKAAPILTASEIKAPAGLMLPMVKYEAPCCCGVEKNESQSPPLTAIEKMPEMGIKLPVIKEEAPCCCGGETTEKSHSPVIEEIKAEDGLTTATFAIDGMSCSCEGEMIEKRMKSLKEIKKFNLNPITKQMMLSYDPGSLSLSDIEKAASKAGVKVVLLKQK
jgi:Cd2+/Zn2+-exporting ATPase